MKGAKKYECKSNFTSKKYVRVIELFANREKISLDDALSFFYHSQVYGLLSAGVSDMHSMSDEYLAEELSLEYKD